jgi:hypothetical protein
MARFRLVSATAGRTTKSRSTNVVEHDTTTPSATGRHARTVTAAGIVTGVALSVATVVGMAPAAQAAPAHTATATVTANAGFDLAQREQAHVLAATSAAIGSATTARPADLGVQGGFDRDHWWVKISVAEIVSVGAGTACKLALPEVGWFVCPPIAAAINAALQNNPNVGGFWGELYTDGRVRVGTW